MSENHSTLPEIQLKNLGKRLRALRKARGYTSSDKFAFSNEINRVQYLRYENGANISFLTLVKILEALDISLKEFFSEGFDE